jgi:hypothetical protein
MMSVSANEKAVSLNLHRYIGEELAGHCRNIRKRKLKVTCAPLVGLYKLNQVDPQA